MADEKRSNMELDDESMEDAIGGMTPQEAIAIKAKAEAEARYQAEQNKTVTCPYCKKKMKNKDLNAHKDKCLLEQAKKAALAELQTELAKQNQNTVITE